MQWWEHMLVFASLLPCLVLMLTCVRTEAAISSLANRGVCPRVVLHL